MRWTDDAVDQLYVAIGDKIRKARLEHDVTQTDLAKRLQLTRSSIANIEAGRQRVMIHWVMQIAEELDLPPMSLLMQPSELPTPATDGQLSAELAGQPATTYEFVESALRRTE